MIIRFATKDDLLRIAEMTRALTVHLGGFKWYVKNILNKLNEDFQIQDTYI